MSKKMSEERLTQLINDIERQAPNSWKQIKERVRLDAMKEIRKKLVKISNHKRSVGYYTFQVKDWDKFWKELLGEKR